MRYSIAVLICLLGLAPEAKAAVIHIHKHKHVSIDRGPLLGVQDIGAALESMAASRMETDIHFDVEKGASYDDVAFVLSEIQKHGHGKLKIGFVGYEEPSKH